MSWMQQQSTTSLQQHTQHQPQKQIHQTTQHAPLYAIHKTVPNNNLGNAAATISTTAAYMNNNNSSASSSVAAVNNVKHFNSVRSQNHLAFNNNGTPIAPLQQQQQLLPVQQTQSAHLSQKLTTTSQLQQQQQFEQEQQRQNLFNAQQHTQQQSYPQHWQQPQVQTTAHLTQQNKMMQPTVSNNNWNQQQHLQTQPTVQPINTSNVYQQQPTTTAALNNNWQPGDLQAATCQQQAAATYANYAPSQPLQYQQQDTTAYFQQPTQQQQDPNIRTQDYFDNNSNHNKTDGWGDWDDWNDNSSNNVLSKEQPQQQHIQQQHQQQHIQQQQQAQHQQPQQHLQQPQQPQQQQQPHIQQVPQIQNTNVNFIEESFNATSNSKDDWNWGISEESKTNTALESPPQVPTNNNELKPPTMNNLEPQQHPQIANDFAIATNKLDNLHLFTTTNTIPELTNDNYNTTVQQTVPPPQIAPVTTNNIPTSSVYVSQAKPVSRPSRQYAAPADSTASFSESTIEAALQPPQGFQNELPLPDAGLLPPPPPVSAPQLSSLPPPTISATPGGNGNPFKRAGVAQHHRSPALLATTTPASVPAPAQFSAPLPPMSAFNVQASPPPPPADFANSAGPTLPIPLENENSEDFHENQEVIASPTPVLMTLSAQPIQQPQQLNDERTQYLQTSQLSENPDEELNVEGDNLPPPGLSRLVLGQPELEANIQQQRMVTGTEQPHSAITAVNLHMEERHADGEDTSSERNMPNPNIAPRMTNSGSVGAASASGAHATGLTSDRNLYLVPGESNNANEQRVVTGVETIAESTTAVGVGLPSAQIISEQRDIDLDGENLEDQQTITVTNRNEPPLEGAATTVTTNIIPTTTDAMETHHSHQHQQIYDSDDTDHLLETHDTSRYVNKSTKVTNDRKMDERPRKEKQRSVDRWNESYDETDEEYSSDRDRRRNYREGSVRSERGDDRDKRDTKDKRRRDKRDVAEREKPSSRDKYGHRSGDVRGPERRSQRYNRYDADSSKYETEESVARHEVRGKEHSRRSTRNNGSDDRGGRSDRSDRDYDEYLHRQRYNRRSTRDKMDLERERGRYAEDDSRRAGDRRQRRDREHDRDDYNTIERRRRAEKHARDPREYEEYRKQSSRNARDSDLEKERNGRGTDPRFDSRMYAGYSGNAGYGYDAYSAYYYEQMARNNPQAYSEWYKKYYASYGATGGNINVPNSSAAAEQLMSGAVAAADGRESVHSGRSSAHNDKERYTQAYISQANEYHRHYQQQQRQHHQLSSYNNHNMSLNSTMGLLDEAATNMSAYSGHYSSHSHALLGAARSTGNLSQIHSLEGYYSGNAAAMPDSISCYAGDLRSGTHLDRISNDPQRLTPVKFLNEHAIVCLSAAGIIVTSKPRYTTQGSATDSVKLLRLGVNDATRQLFETFPGPLVRGLAHKKTIIDFCQEQIKYLNPAQTTIYAKQMGPESADKYIASYTLMWNLLILLLRQNGVVVGADIAELLLKNQEQYPYQSITQTTNSESKTDTETESNEELLEEKEQEVAESSGQDAIVEPDLTTISEAEVTEKFRNFLLYGNVNEALNWATDNNLWGHALFLASKVDRRSHANVMMKFANKLSLNDPLQTLYQLMSGRTPSSVQSVQDEKWGDWRPHLSMILSNTSQKPELDRKAITTLGDSLFQRGDIFAAHFCYLMAQVNFGRYQESASLETALQQQLPKLVLLGSSHYKTFSEFATNEAIIMTEIYEYACSLNDENFSLVEFQPYKYLLATRLLDYGYHLKSLMYLEQVALHIQRDPSKYEISFVNKVFEIADRLKYYDPVLEKTMDDQLQGGDEGVSNTNSQGFEEQKWLQSLREIANHQQIEQPSVNNYVPEQNSNYSVQNQIDQQFMEINKQFNELNLQYAENTMQSTLQPPSQMAEHKGVEQAGLPATVTDYANQQQQYAADSLQQHTQHQAAQLIDPYAQYQQVGYDQQQLQQQQSAYYDPTQQQAATMDAQGFGAAGNADYDYWQAQQQQQQAVTDENARPTISMPKSKSYDSDDERTKQQAQKGGAEQVKKTKNDVKEIGKSAQQSNQNSGWFGGIWNKLTLKPSNQMRLPDDKNPSIVWDADKKCWVNTDGDDANESESFKPPPKMGDFMQQQQVMQAPPQQLQQPALPQQQQPQQTAMHDVSQYGNSMPTVNNNLQYPVAASTPLLPTTATAQSYSAAAASNVVQTVDSTVNAQPKPPSLQSNMFKMQRNRTLKNSYVDVFNPSGAPMSKAAESVLAPTVPASAVPQGGFFIPGATPGDGGAYQQQQDVPQFYNPNHYGAGGAGAY